MKPARRYAKLASQAYRIGIHPLHALSILNWALGELQFRVDIYYLSHFALYSYVLQFVDIVAQRKVPIWQATIIDCMPIEITAYINSINLQLIGRGAELVELGIFSRKGRPLQGFVDAPKRFILAARR